MAFFPGEQPGCATYVGHSFVQIPVLPSLTPIARITSVHHQTLCGNGRCRYWFEKLASLRQLLQRFYMKWERGRRVRQLPINLVCCPHSSKDLSGCCRKALYVRFLYGSSCSNGPRLCRRVLLLVLLVLTQNEGGDCTLRLGLQVPSTCGGTNTYNLRKSEIIREFGLPLCSGWARSRRWQADY